MDDDNGTKQLQRRKQQRVDFENCLGKHTDSLEHALAALSYHLKQKSSEQSGAIFRHEGEVNSISGTSKPVYEVGDRGDQYLLSQRTGSNEPVYDTPKPPPSKIKKQ